MNTLDKEKRRAELLAEAKKLAKKIAEEYKPEKIILFGSAATGDVREYSDVDLFVIKEISFSQAVLGDEIVAPTLQEKDILLKIPAGTNSGKVFRISGQGIPSFGGSRTGNLYVEIQVEIPKRLSRKQKVLLNELKKEGL